MNPGPVACAALAAVLSAPAVRAAEFDRGDLRLELSAQLRSLYRLSRELDVDHFVEGSTTRRDSWGLLSRARVELEGNWRDRIYGELIYDVESRTGTTLDTLGFAIGEEIGARTWLDADRVFSRHEDGHWRHVLYRAWLRWESDRVELTVGRQRIPLGRGRLWNPTDLFNPIFPLAIEGEQRIGQDGIRARWKLSERLWAEAMWTREEDPRELIGALSPAMEDVPGDTNTAVRLELARVEMDAAIMVGRFGRDYVFGADVARNVGDAAFRGEATFTDLDEGGRIWQVVASLDYTFSIGSGLYGLVEHLYNENVIGSLDASAFAPPGPIPPGALEPLVREIARLQAPFLDRITSFARNQTGFGLSYTFNPLVSTNVFGLYDWNGPSAAIFPVATFTLRDDLVLTMGGQLFIGPRGRSEYGGAANLVFLQLDAYF